MAENVYREPEKEKSGNKDKKDNKFQSGLQSVLDGSFLARGKSTDFLPFFVFLAFIAVILIANTYYAEKKVREIEGMRSELTEMRTLYISNKAELMFLGNQSEIAKKLKDEGFVESTVPPRLISIERNNRHFLLRIFGKR